MIMIDYRVTQGKHALKKLRYKFHSTRTTHDFHVDPEEFMKLLIYIDYLEEENANTQR